MKNTCGKIRKVNEPYEVWRSHNGRWEWRILKKYQGEDKERENVYARWFCAVKSPMTAPGYDMGDVYIREIKSQAYMVAMTSPAEIQNW